MPIYAHRCDGCGAEYENEHADFSYANCKECGLPGIRRNWSVAPAIGSVRGAGGSKSKPSTGRKKR